LSCATNNCQICWNISRDWICRWCKGLNSCTRVKFCNYWTEGDCSFE
jgi:hypothetical protein